MTQTKHICDRCGKEITPTRLTFLRSGYRGVSIFRLAINGDGFGGATKDLCKDCEKSFWNWLKNVECEEK